MHENMRVCYRQVHVWNRIYASNLYVSLGYGATLLMVQTDKTHTQTASFQAAIKDDTHQMNREFGHCCRQCLEEHESVPLSVAQVRHPVYVSDKTLGSRRSLLVQCADVRSDPRKEY